MKDNKVKLKMQQCCKNNYYSFVFVIINSSIFILTKTKNNMKPIDFSVCDIVYMHSINNNKTKKMNQKINEIEINGIVYVPKSCVTNLSPKVDGMKCVLIRSYGAGVHFGFLKEEKFTESGKVVTLINSRRVWSWDGAASLSQMAVDGVSKPDNCKFSVVVEENEIVNVIETLQLTEKSFLSLKSVKEWKQ